MPSGETRRVRSTVKVSLAPQGDRSAGAPVVELSPPAGINQTLMTKGRLSGRSIQDSPNRVFSAPIGWVAESKYDERPVPIRAGAPERRGTRWPSGCDASKDASTLAGKRDGDQPGQAWRRTQLEGGVTAVQLQSTNAVGDP